MTKISKRFTIICLSVFSLLVIYSWWRRIQVDKDGVYILAKVNKIYDSENGKSYHFTYFFKGETYTSGVKAFIKLRDSLIMIKVSKSTPKLWEIVYEDIPKCVFNDSALNKYWQELPKCN